MKLVKAKVSDVDLIYNIISKSIKGVYRKKDDGEIVDFFLMIHSRENIQKDVENNDFWIIEDKGNFVGTGFCHDNHISCVYMVPDCQGKGYGTYIMDYLEREISKNFDSAILDPTKSAIPFYEKRGYVVISHEDTYLEHGTYLAHDVMKKQFS